MTAKTTLAKQAAWPGKPAGRTTAPVDTSVLMITNDPMPASRQVPGKKYEALFAKMKPGQAIKCQPRDVGKVANSMRKFIKDKGKASQLMVRSCQSYPDDKLGRVWMWQREAA